MKVKLHKWLNIESHCYKNKVMLNAFLDFKSQLAYCDWNIPSDMTKSFRTADIVQCKKQSYNRVIFNIGGNKYRLICGYKFGKSQVVLYIRFVGTHKEYDRIKGICGIDMFK